MGGKYNEGCAWDGCVGEVDNDRLVLLPDIFQPPSDSTECETWLLKDGLKEGIGTVCRFVTSLTLDVIFHVSDGDEPEDLELTFQPELFAGGLVDLHLSFGELRLAGGDIVDILYSSMFKVRFCNCS